MSTEPFIGEIKILGFNFAPVGYALCAGQTMSIAQNSALFALLGTTYGGNGIQTFGLPDLQGRVPIGQGQGGGLPAYIMGQKSGNTSVTILPNNMPVHNHGLSAVTVKIKASSATADETAAEGNFAATTANGAYSGNGASPGVYTAGTEVSGQTDIAGGGAPVSIMNPYLVINYSIATQGIFPSRP